MPDNPVFDSYGEAVGAVGVVVPSGVDLDRYEANDLVREPSLASSGRRRGRLEPPV